jgi:hypothetical protein
MDALPFLLLLLTVYSHVHCCSNCPLIQGKKTLIGCKFWGIIFDASSMDANV